MITVCKVGLTYETHGDVMLALDGDMPKDCVVVFMDKESWEELKPLVATFKEGQ